MKTVALFAALAGAASAKLGFNYGSTFTTGAAKMQSDFEAEFTTAANLKGTSGWTSARLYTMIQAGTASDPISAIPAAIKTKTSLLLGLWASAGDAAFANELAALRTAIKQYGSDFASLVDGISIGSEDLYRNSPQGIAAGSTVGVDPPVLLRYIQQVRDAIAGTPLESAPLGHVDTWTAWDNATAAAPLVGVLDWIGMDAYPYFQNTMANAIGESKPLFDTALGATMAAAKGKPVWVTETGYPVSGKVSGQAVASVQNAQTFWKTVGCPMFGNTNVWWYTLQDAEPDTPNPSFGIVGSTLSTTPLFDLSCDSADTEPPAPTGGNTGTTTTTTNKAASPNPTSTAVSSEPATSQTSETAPASTDAPTGGDDSSSSSSSSSQVLPTDTTITIPAFSPVPVPSSTGSASGSSSSASSGFSSSGSSSGAGSSSGSSSSSSSSSETSASPSASSSGATPTSAAPSTTSSVVPDSGVSALRPGTVGTTLSAVLVAAFFAL